VRFVVYGAGAIGGFVAARLGLADIPVTLIARGEHALAIRKNGFQVLTPDNDYQVPLDVIESAADIHAGNDTFVLLCVKSHSTTAALRELRNALPDSTPVACLQNGVDNERQAARLFAHVYGVSVMCPNTFLEPGIISAYSSPTIGALDTGPYVGGNDSQLNELSLSFKLAGFASSILPNIMEHKYGKLLNNLGNAVEVVCGPPARRGPVTSFAQQEGRACFEAHSIPFTEDSPNSSLVTPQPIHGQKRPAGSTWQSVQRRSAGTETDYLNGEIVMLGRQAGVATPMNRLLQELVRRVGSDPELIGSFPEADVIARAGYPPVSGG